jgi:hypothetical protein
MQAIQIVPVAGHSGGIDVDVDGLANTIACITWDNELSTIYFYF